jgi:RNA polymerase sigma-70 factor (ECF subfamily)
MALGAHLVLSEGIAIAQQAQETAADELETLVRDYARLVYRIAFSVLRSPEDAEDAVQEVFARVLRSRHKLAEVLDRKAYLARIAWRVAVDSRRTRPEVSIDAHYADESGSELPVIAELRDRQASLEKVAGDRQMMSMVEQAIASLPVDLREALTLSAIEELSAAEAGEVLGVAEATVRTRVFRARQMLREKLAAMTQKPEIRSETRNA